MPHAADLCVEPLHGRAVNDREHRDGVHGREDANHIGIGKGKRRGCVRELDGASDRLAVALHPNAELKPICSVDNQELQHARRSQRAHTYTHIHIHTHTHTYVRV